MKTIETLLCASLLFNTISGTAIGQDGWFARTKRDFTMWFYSNYSENYSRLAKEFLIRESLVTGAKSSVHGFSLPDFKHNVNVDGNGIKIKVYHPVETRFEIYGDPTYILVIKDIPIKTGNGIEEMLLGVYSSIRNDNDNINYKVVSVFDKPDGDYFELTNISRVDNYLIKIANSLESLERFNYQDKKDSESIMETMGILSNSKKIVLDEILLDKAFRSYGADGEIKFIVVKPNKKTKAMVVFIPIYYDYFTGTESIGVSYSNRNFVTVAVSAPDGGMDVYTAGGNK